MKEKKTLYNCYIYPLECFLRKYLVRIYDLFGFRDFVLGARYYNLN